MRRQVRAAQKAPPLVAEVMLEDGTWAAFSSERTPQTLGDAIKDHYAKFFMASQTLAPEALKDIAPVAFPIARNVQGCALIVSYPADTWKKMGEPYFSGVSWRRLATKVADDDLENLLLQGRKTRKAGKAWGYSSARHLTWAHCLGRPGDAWGHCLGAQATLGGAA